MKKFNDALALKITMAFSTMWAFYVFVIYGLTPLMWPAYQDKIMYWSNFFQLIALPALAVGSVILNRSSERRDQEMYDMVKEENAGMREELKELKEMNQELKELVEYLHKKEGNQ